MKRIVFDEKERVAQFLVEQGAIKTIWQDYEAIGLEQDGKLIAGVLYDGYEENARVSTHAAGIGKHWLNREYLWVIFDYPFNQLNVNVIVNTVSSTNQASMRFTEHLGFKEVARIEGGACDGDLIIYALYKKDCKWIRNKHGK